jgi:hypothetical protein
MAARQRTELHRVGRLLTGELPAAVLPDMLEDGESVPGGRDADGVEERVIRAAAGRQLDPDHPAGNTACNLGDRVRCIVRVDGDVPADAIRVVTLEAPLHVVGVLDVLAGRKVDRRREPPGSQHRAHMEGHADPLAGLEAAGVSLAPVGARTALVQEVCVDVYQHVCKMDRTG